MTYLRVKNHDKYQHYKDRNPPWIKLYRSMLADYDLRQIPIVSRLFFVYCTILSSETDNRIPHDLKYLSERVGFPVTEVVINPLLERGLLLALGARRVLAYDATCSPLSSLLLINPPDANLKSNGHAIPKRKIRPIGDDDKPTEKNLTFALTMGIDPGPEWGKFKNYCLAHDKRYANFEAAFRNWLANSLTMNPTKGGHS